MERQGCRKIWLAKQSIHYSRDLINFCFLSSWLVSIHSLVSSPLLLFSLIHRLVSFWLPWCSAWEFPTYLPWGMGKPHYQPSHVIVADEWTVPYHPMSLESTVLPNHRVTGHSNHSVYTFPERKTRFGGKVVADCIFPKWPQHFLSPVLF